MTHTKFLMVNSLFSCLEIERKCSYAATRDLKTSGGRRAVKMRCTLNNDSAAAVKMQQEKNQHDSIS